MFWSLRNASTALLESDPCCSPAIASSPEARACYSATWTRYAFGRAEAASDECAISVLGAHLADDNYKVTDMMVDLTRTRAFMFRGAN